MKYDCKTAVFRDVPFEHLYVWVSRSGQDSSFMKTWVPVCFLSRCVWERGAGSQERKRILTCWNGQWWVCIFRTSSMPYLPSRGKKYLCWLKENVTISHRAPTFEISLSSTFTKGFIFISYLQYLTWTERTLKTHHFPITPFQMRKRQKSPHSASG